MTRKAKAKLTGKRVWSTFPYATREEIDAATGTFELSCGYDREHDGCLYEMQEHTRDNETRYCIIACTYDGTGDYVDIVTENEARSFGWII